MLCFKCGAEVSDNASFCTNCGAKLSGNEQPVQAAQPIAAEQSAQMTEQQASQVQPAVPEQTAPTAEQQAPQAQPVPPTAPVQPPQPVYTGQAVPMQQPAQPQQYQQPQPWQPVPSQSAYNQQSAPIQQPPLPQPQPIPPQSQQIPPQQPIPSQSQQTPPQPPVPPRTQQMPPQQSMYQAPVTPQQPMAAKPKKNLALPIVCISVAVAAVAALVIVLIITMGRNNDDSNKGGASSTVGDESGIITTNAVIEVPVETDAPETTVTESAVTTSPEVTEATTAAETVSSSEAQTTSPDASGTGSIRSTISGNTIKSELFKIQAEMDNDWEFGSDAEVAELNNMSGSSPADFEQAIKEKSVFYDAFARKSTGSNIIFAIPNPDVASSVLTSEKAYAEATLDGIKGIDSNAAVSAITFAGKTHQAIKVTNSSMGTTFKQCLVFVKSGRYVCMITFTCFTDDELNEVMGRFKSLD